MSNKTSDKNVGSIEKISQTSDNNVANVEVIKNFILELKEFELNRDTLEVTNALEELLAEREQKDKRIQELEEALLKVKEKNTTLFITCRNSIPKQVVIDKIEEVHSMKFKDDRLDSATIDFAVHKFGELL